MPEEEEKAVLFEEKGPIAFITLNRPKKINAMNGEMYDQLLEAIKEFTANDTLMCAVVSGAGGNFSSGGDLKWFQERRENKLGNYDFPAYKAMERCPKPIIAAIDGICLASGFNLAVLYCDIRIVSERVRMGIPAVKRGLNLPYPIPYTWHMTLGNALYLVLTGKELGAEEALRYGVVNEIVPHEKLLERAAELATIISEGAPLHVRAHKQFLRQFVQVPGSYGQSLIDLIMGPIQTAEDTSEGTKAFLEKRDPHYKAK
jgi:enoyl-CoA hydratase/carnithine racemase